MRMRTCVLMQPMQSRSHTYVGRRSQLHVQLTLLPGDGDGDGCGKGNARLLTAMMGLPLTSSAYRSHGVNLPSIGKR